MELAVGEAINLLEMLTKGLKGQEICVWGGQMLLVLGWTCREGLYLFLVRGRYFQRAFNLSEISRFSRKRRLGLDESPVVVWEHGWVSSPCSNTVWQRDTANQDAWWKYMHLALFPFPFLKGWLQNPGAEPLTDSALNSWGISVPSSLISVSSIC